MGDTQKNWVISQTVQSPHFKYYPQLQTKEDVEGGESQLWEVTKKSTVNKGDCDADLSPCLLHW